MWDDVGMPPLIELALSGTQDCQELRTTGVRHSLDSGCKGLPSLQLTRFLYLCSRLNPKNVHQRPTVALLCGPHVKGAQGISCGRHLANHDVQVILFLPNFVKMLESITNELSLFSKTQGQQVSSLKGESSCLGLG